MPIPLPPRTLPTNPTTRAPVQSPIIIIDFPDGYTYSREELEAYKVPHRIRMSKCVDIYIPMKQCMAKQNLWNNLFDPLYFIGNLGKATVMMSFRNFKPVRIISFFKFYFSMEIQQATHPLNAFYFDQNKAREDGLSNTLAQKFYKSPMAYTY
jgi:hypothetical protein